MSRENDWTEKDPRVVYADIIDLPHWDSPVHPRMSLHDRAAQFAPYSALVGYGDLVSEEARETDTFMEPGEDEAEELAWKLAILAEMTEKGIQPVCTISYFVPDARKDGGKTVTVTVAVKRIDPVQQRIFPAKSRKETDVPDEINLERVTRLSSEIFSEEWE